jgi:hypothetical protein
MTWCPLRHTISPRCKASLAGFQASKVIWSPDKVQAVHGAFASWQMAPIQQFPANFHRPKVADFRHFLSCLLFNLLFQFLVIDRGGKIAAWLVSSLRTKRDRTR